MKTAEAQFYYGGLVSLLEGQARGMRNPYDPKTMEMEHAMAGAIVDAVPPDVLNPLLGNSAHMDGWLFSDSENTHHLADKLGMKRKDSSGTFYPSPGNESPNYIFCCDSSLSMPEIRAIFRHEATHYLDYMSHRLNKGGGGVKFAWRFSQERYDKLIASDRLTFGNWERILMTWRKQAKFRSTPMHRP